MNITTGTREIKGKGGKIEIYEEGLEDLFGKFEEVILTMKHEFPEVPAFIIWDSIAATPTKRELGEDYENEAIAEAARVISRGFKKINKVLIGSRVSLIYINQIRAKISGFGPVYNTQPGGRGLRHYSSTIVEIARTAPRSSYITCKAKNKKNKLAVPFVEASFKIEFNTGLVDIK